MPSGATCTASFSVQDAQGRRTNADRDGRLLLDLQGFPRAPASIAQTGYADGTLTLRVDPGEARLAYPAITGFIVRSGGVEVGAVLGGRHLPRDLGSERRAAHL